MSEFRFIHAADIHLDSPMRRLSAAEGAPVELYRWATRRALARLVDLARAERVDFVLIAGDVYDDVCKDYGTPLYFRSQMERLREAEIPVYLIRGNHDYDNADALQLSLPANVHMFEPDRAHSLEVPGLDVLIHGQSFGTRRVDHSLAAGYPRAEKNAFNLGLLHTSLVDRPGHDTYSPCSPIDLRGLGYDYWALGHIHTREELPGETPIHFAGNIQGRHAREPGAKGCLLVTVRGHGRPAVEFRPLDDLRWSSCHVDAAGKVDDDLLAAVVEAVEAEVAAAEERHVAVRVEVRDEADILEGWEPGRLLHEVRAVFARRCGGRAWVDRVDRRRMVAPRAAAEGPVAEILDQIEALERDEAALLEFAGRSLKELKQELLGNALADEHTPSLLDPARLRDAMAAARRRLVGGLTLPGPGARA